MKWVKVEDRLPEDGTKCIVWAGGNFWEAHFYCGRFELLLTVSALEPSREDVTHWFIPTSP